MERVTALLLLVRAVRAGVSSTLEAQERRVAGALTPIIQEFALTASPRSIARSAAGQAPIALTSSRASSALALGHAKPRTCVTSSGRTERTAPT